MKNMLAAGEAMAVRKKKKPGKKKMPTVPKMKNPFVAKGKKKEPTVADYMKGEK